MRFTVLRREIWVQKITVEADSIEEARKKAELEDGEINDDPQFKDLTKSDTWEVLREE